MYLHSLIDFKPLMLYNMWFHTINVHYDSDSFVKLIFLLFTFIIVYSLILYTRNELTLLECPLLFRIFCEINFPIIILHSIILYSLMISILNS